MYMLLSHFMLLSASLHKVNQSNDLFPLLLMTQNDLVIGQILLLKKKELYSANDEFVQLKNEIPLPLLF